MYVCAHTHECTGLYAGMYKSRVRLFATPRTAAHQALLSMRFSRQGFWSGLPFPSPGDLPNPGIEPRSPALQADPLPTELQGKPMYKSMCIDFGPRAYFYVCQETETT